VTFRPFRKAAVVTKRY